MYGVCVCVCLCSMAYPGGGGGGRDDVQGDGAVVVQRGKRERDREKEEHPRDGNERSTGADERDTACQPASKQGFYIGKDLPLESDKVKAHPELLGQNMFPASLPDGDFRLPTERYYAAVLDLSMRVLEILAKGLPYGDDIFHEFVSNDPVCIMRLLHYPPQPQAPPRDERQLGAGAHTDFGTSLSLFALPLSLSPPRHLSS